jgi:hypothetical protein
MQTFGPHDLEKAGGWSCYLKLPKAKLMVWKNNLVILLIFQYRFKEIINEQEEIQKQFVRTLYN